MKPFRAISWSPGKRAPRFVDQRELPARELVRDVTSIDDVIDAIRTLAIRGAPAIGVAAAIGLTVAVRRTARGDVRKLRELLPWYGTQLIAARPTAVNLSWAIKRMLVRATTAADDVLLQSLCDEADNILAEDIASCAAIGANGAPLIHEGASILTHCNAGALATAGIGTALAPIYIAHERGVRLKVYACETRPLRQGARLTAWELSRAGIEVTVLPDSAAASLLRDGAIDMVIVGADRIVRNGDVANKIGTYPLALAAHAHHVPFYVAAPISTFDRATPVGASVTIEHRSAKELGRLPRDVYVWNPAFDITPRRFVTSYITDVGVKASTMSSFAKFRATI